MKLKIKVTKEDLLNGKKCAGYKCAIALAVRDIFPNAFVWEMGIRINGAHDSKNEIKLPIEVTVFIMGYDHGFLMETPFEFEIDIPEEIINKINIDELKPLLVNHKNLKLITT